jgi:ribosomal protein S18 acetylase RimI-like enzyme
MKDSIEVKTKRYRYVLVQKEIRFKGVAYILVREARENSVTGAADAAAAHLEKNGAREITLTCSDQDVALPDIVTTPGGRTFRYVYDMDWLEKDLAGFNPVETPLCLQPITARNRSAFQRIYNECFFSVPNGATYTRSDVTKLLLNPADAGMVMRGGEAIGIYEMSSAKDAYIIDALGIAAPYRGTGYGRQVLHLLLAEIRKRGGRQAGLFVCTANETAYGLYLKAGFKKRYTRSRWYRMQ